MSAPSPLSRRSRTPWRGVDVVMVLVLSFFLGLVAYSLVSQAVHLADTGLSKGDRSSVEAMVGQLAFYAAAMAATLLVLLVRHRGLRMGELGWRTTSRGWLLAAVPLTIAGLGIASLLTGVAQSLMPHTENVQCLAVRSEYGHSVLLALPVVSLAAPVVEETIFRGVLYRWLRGLIPPPAAMALSGALFALFHFVPLLFLPLLGLGVLLAWAYERSGSIWPGVLVHGVFNAIGVVAILTAPSC